MRLCLNIFLSRNQIPKPIPKPVGRQTKFQVGHEIEFGVRVLHRESITEDISAVRCQFCEFHGRESIPGQKHQRQQTNRTKDWKAPFRVEYYRDHLQSQHPIRWEEYQLLSSEEKKQYFDNKVEYKDTLFRHFDLQDDKIVYHIDASIVEKVIGEMFFHSDEYEGISLIIFINYKGVSQAIALKLFVKDLNGPNYTITIKKPMQFRLAVKFLAIGVSFRQVEALILATKEETGVIKLSGLNDTGVANYARVVCGMSLQKLSTILNNDATWAFSLANDISTHYSRSYFDNRIRFHRDGIIYNVHVLALPIHDSHSSENMFKLVSELFDVICPMWRTKLISVSSDSASSMIGKTLRCCYSD